MSIQVQLEMCYSSDIMKAPQGISVIEKLLQIFDFIVNFMYTC